MRNFQKQTIHSDCSSGHVECRFDNRSKVRGEFAAIFDSQTESFLSQKGQSTKSVQIHSKLNFVD